MIDDPRLAIGANFPPSIPEQIATELDLDLPDQVAKFVASHDAVLGKQVSDILDEARALPKEITDDAALGKTADVIKRIRELKAGVESTHAARKAPYFNSGKAVDNFFFPLWEKLMKRGKNDRDGAYDVLCKRCDDYQQRKLVREQEERRKEDERLRKEAEEKRQAEELARQKADQDRLAAERARKPETAVAKEAVAGLSEAAALEAAAEAAAAAERAQEAHIATLATPAAMTRTRFESGAMATMGTESYALVTNEALLDKEKLWPFIKIEAKKQALKSWAKTMGFNQQMAGAEIGRKPKTQIR